MDNNNNNNNINNSKTTNNDNNKNNNNININNSKTIDNNKDKTENKIIEILEGLRPYLNMDGGDVEFIKYENKIVYVKLTGACQACLFSDETIKNGLYESIKAEVSEIEGVINVEL